MSTLRAMISRVDKTLSNIKASSSAQVRSTGLTVNKTQDQSATDIVNFMAKSGMDGPSGPNETLDQMAQAIGPVMDNFNSVLVGPHHITLLLTLSHFYYLGPELPEHLQCHCEHGSNCGLEGATNLLRQLVHNGRWQYNRFMGCLWLVASRSHSRPDRQSHLLSISRRLLRRNQSCNLDEATSKGRWR